MNPFFSIQFLPEEFHQASSLSSLGPGYFTMKLPDKFAADAASDPGTIGVGLESQVRLYMILLGISIMI